MTWNPIVTAPKDGTLIQVRAREYAECHARWKDGMWKFLEYSHPAEHTLTEWREKPSRDTGGL